MELNNKSLFKEKCFVNGLWTDSLSGKTIEVNNPATMEIVGKVPNFILFFFGYLFIASSWGISSSLQLYVTTYFWEFETSMLTFFILSMLGTLHIHLHHYRHVFAFLL